MSFAKSSSPIDNSKTCRHAVTIFYLVLRITNEVTTPCRHEESDANNQFQGIERLGDNAGEADDFLRAYAAALGSATRNDFSGLRVYGQETEQKSPLMPAERLSKVPHYTVSRVNPSARFYQDRLRLGRAIPQRLRWPRRPSTGRDKLSSA